MIVLMIKSATAAAVLGVCVLPLMWDTVGLDASCCHWERQVHLLPSGNTGLHTAAEHKINILHTLLNSFTSGEYM